MPIAPSGSFVIVSFFLEKHYIPQYYRLLTCYDFARLLQCFGQGGCYFGCDAAIPEHNVFCYSAVAHILAFSVNWAFGPNLGFRNKCRAPTPFKLQNEALLQLCVGMYEGAKKGRLKGYIPTHQK